MYFRYFVIISPLERAWPYIWTSLNPLHAKVLCAKFGWNWLCRSWDEDENVKSLRQRRQQRRRTTVKFWSEKLTWAFGSGDLKTRSCAKKWTLKAGAQVWIAASRKMLGKFNFLCSFHIWVSFLKIYGFSDFNKFLFLYVVLA